MFVIRDDDLSAWTDINEIKKLYGHFLEEGGKVSFATVPNAVEPFYRGNRSMMYQGVERKEILLNKELVDYLRPYIRCGQVEIMQHGYDHGYYVEAGGSRSFLDKETRKQIGNTKQVRFVPECCAKEKKTLTKDLMEGRTILEDTFGVKIKVFVPPSNGLTAESADIVNRMGMNISGTITNKFNRKADIYSLSVFLKKALWKAGHSKVAYPKVMKYNNHMELIGHAFTPTTNKANFNRQLEFCMSNDYSFVLATHYWELLSNEDLKADFYEVIFERLKNGEMSTLTEEFTKYERGNSR